MKTSFVWERVLRRQTCRCLFGFALLSSVLGSSHAGLIVDTGPALYSSNNGEVLANQDGYYQFFAGAFTVTQDTKITGINGWIGAFTAGNLKIGVAADSFGFPGNDLFSQSVFIAAHVPTAWRGVGSLDWDLAPGSYWITFKAEQSSFEGFMTGGASNPMSKYAITGSGLEGWFEAGWATLGVQVFGDPEIVEPPPPMQPAPEPSTYGLFGGIALCALIVRRMKKRQPSTAALA